MGDDESMEEGWAGGGIEEGRGERNDLGTGGDLFGSGRVGFSQCGSGEFE